jgi:hypothetical protein
VGDIEKIFSQWRLGNNADEQLFYRLLCGSVAVAAQHLRS